MYARKLKDRTVFMDFRTDPTENVFPMVKAGNGINEMLLGSEDLYSFSRLAPVAAACLAPNSGVN